MNVAYWACLTIANVWMATDHQIVGAMWLVLALVLSVCLRTREAT